jgi:hypothetical protein
VSGAKEILFRVETCPETGGYVARWDAPGATGGITTQGDSFAELDAMVADAVKGYFADNTRPTRIRRATSVEPRRPGR